MPRRGDAARGPQLHGRHQPARVGPPQCDLRASAPAQARWGSCPRAGPSGSRSSITQPQGLGLASFIAIGNKADLSGNDFLQDGRLTRPARLSRCTSSRWATPASPAVSRGAWGAPSRSSPSRAGGRRRCPGDHVAHRGAHRPSDITVEALFRQAGVVRRIPWASSSTSLPCSPSSRCPRGRRRHPHQRGRTRDPRGGRL